MLEDILNERKRKLALYQKESNPYPAKVKRTGSILGILKNFDALARLKKTVFLAGRLKGLRDQGKIIFGDLVDESGGIQVVLDAENTGGFSLAQKTFDIGDFVEVAGRLFKTKRGEKSLLVQDARMIAKSLRPLPSQWYGLEDVESRLRQRYLDLILRPEVKDIFVKKSRFWSEIRQYLTEAGFLEVETPVLENMPGGADAEPFKTHLNALDMDLYLRISLELYQKRLLVGGFEKVFEIGRVFRNEGMDAEHLQDYVQLEFYWAYADYNDLMEFLEKMLRKVIKNTFGTLKIKSRGHLADWGKKWRVADYAGIFKKAVKLDPLSAPLEDLRKKASELDLKPETGLGRGRLIDLIFKKEVRPSILEPTFVINHPIEISPLAKRLPDDPGKAQRVQVFAYGSELGNGWSELNDPNDQRKRFEAQMKLREQGDKEAQRLDEDFLEALEYGMPPAAGFGMSERFFAVLADKPVREAVFFPLMKPKP